MPAFYDGIDPDLATKIKVDDWDRLSAQHRFRFWKGIHEHLSRLSNRIDPETAQDIMRQIHESVPMPTPEESTSSSIAEDSIRTSESWNETPSTKIRGPGLTFRNIEDRYTRSAGLSPVGSERFDATGLTLGKANLADASSPNPRMNEPTSFKPFSPP